MLTLILGTDWVANREAVLRLIADDVRQCKAGRILMVPELISHDMERRLCAAAGDTASRYAQVLSFTQLARRVSESAGSAAMECMDAGGRVVAMASAARQLKNVLKAYAAVETKPEFLTGMVDAVDEFKRCCISPADLMQASKHTEGAFAQKLEELSLILEAYDGICQRGKRDPRDLMTWLLEALQDSDFARDHTFYIDGFPDFTRQNFAIIEHLLEESQSVTVSLNCDKVDSKLMAFEKAGATASALVRSAERLGIDVQIRYTEPCACAAVPVHGSLFQGKIVPCDVVTAYPAVSIHAECMAAAERILEFVKNGCRYRQIGVVCADMAGYQNVIRYIFRRSGIPVYQSGKEEILSKSVIHTVLSAVDAALGGFDRMDVLQYLKSALSPIDAATCDHLENYAIIWNVHGNQWLETWNKHPEGLDAKWTEETQEELAMINAAKETAMWPLAQLRDDIRKSTSLAGQVVALTDFLENIHMAERLEQLADDMEQQGELRSAQILNQLWEILIGALEQLYDILGNTAWEAETFVKLLTLLLSQYDVGTIPPVLDSVAFGTIESLRCQQVEHLIVLGAQEGMLPSYSGGDGILTDQEREALRSLGVPLTGGGLEGLQAEFANIYGVFCGARNTVTVSYSGGQPSFVYRRLSEMAQGEAPEANANRILNRMDAAGLLVKAGDKKTADAYKLDDLYLKIAEKRQYALGKLSKQTVNKLYNKTLRLSASQTDRLAECRFSYFMQYGLAAKERKEAQVDPTEFGTYVHAVLENTAREVMQRGGFHKVTLETTRELAQQYSEAYIQERFNQLDSKRMTYLLRRNLAELNMVVDELWKELNISEFEPKDFELAFGEGCQMPGIEIEGASIPAVLRGFVDRIDIWKKENQQYFRVVDYKTGQKDFDYCDVFNGIGLQMLLYLFALAQNGENLFAGKALPAGVQYFPARSAFLSANGRLSEEEAEEARNKNWKRKGLILADDQVIEAMEPEGAANRLSYKRGKDGQLAGDVASAEQLKQLREYIFDFLKKLVDQVASGEVLPNPYTRGNVHSACTYCAYAEVCHYATVEGRRNYKAMSADEFWDRIGKEMRHNG